MRLYSIFTAFFICVVQIAFAQKDLPDFSVENSGGRVIVSWRNNLTKPIANLNVQRSYDSTTNFATIGAVLNASEKENGYLDANPPYNAMFYRIFIAFEDGTYIIATPKRPINTDTSKGYYPSVVYDWDLNRVAEDSSFSISDSIPAYVQGAEAITNPTKPKNPPMIVDISKPNVPPPPTYPSAYVFTSKQSSVVIHLSDYEIGNYSLDVFDEAGKKIFTLTNLNDEMLVMDKGNFPRSGWYFFTLYRMGREVERNKFFLPKDPPKPNKQK